MDAELKTLLITYEYTAPGVVSAHPCKACKLEPRFDPEVTEYRTQVASSSTEVDVTALGPRAADGKRGTVSVEGGKDLKIGWNTVLITVQSANGLNSQQYKIQVRRKQYAEVVRKQQITFGSLGVVAALALGRIIRALRS